MRAYGQYYGDGIARERYEDRIVIYRDTLTTLAGMSEVWGLGLFPFVTVAAF